MPRAHPLILQYQSPGWQTHSEGFSATQLIEATSLARDGRSIGLRPKKLLRWRPTCGSCHSLARIRSPSPRAARTWSSRLNTCGVSWDQSRWPDGPARRGYAAAAQLPGLQVHLGAIYGDALRCLVCQAKWGSSRLPNGGLTRNASKKEARKDSAAFENVQWYDASTARIVVDLFRADFEAFNFYTDPRRMWEAPPEPRVPFLREICAAPPTVKRSGLASRRRTAATRPPARGASCSCRSQ